MKNAQDAMLGGFLGSEILQEDPLLNPSTRDSKRSAHVLDDAVSLPGEQDFPPRINTLRGYPNPLTDPLAW